MHHLSATRDWELVHVLQRVCELINKTTEASGRLAETARCGVDALCIVATDSAMYDGRWLDFLDNLLALTRLVRVKGWWRADFRLRWPCTMFIVVGSSVSIKIVKLPTKSYLGHVKKYASGIGGSSEIVDVAVENLLPWAYLMLDSLVADIPLVRADETEGVDDADVDH
jgi:hypothetical protein